jgi:opacity protein-like surface antigen
MEGDRMKLKKAAVIGLTGFALGVSPASADSIGDGSTVALTMVGGGGVMALGCMAIALLTQDDEAEGEEEAERYDRRGFFVGLSGSYARENFSDSDVVDLIDGELQDNLRLLRGTPVLPSPPGDRGVYTFNLEDVDSDAFGATGRGGYRCHPRISAELQFEKVTDFDGSIMENGTPSNDSARNFDLELESLVFTNNLKGHLLTGRTQPFALLGVGFMRMESKAYDSTGASTDGRAANARERTVNVAFRYGAGLDFYLTKNVVMTAEGSYLMPLGKLDGLDYYQFGVGLQYRF